MKIWISNRQRKTTLNLEKLRKKSGKILSALGWAEAELSLTLTGDRAMARLNRETFGRRGPTNVIAFPLEESAFPPAHEFPKDASRTTPTETPAGEEEPLAFSEETRRGTACCAPGPHADWPPVMLGEVVISVETTRRQARETGWDWEELLDFFLIHGILHLLGYDHEDPESQARMDAKTWELMGLLHPEIRKDEVI